MTIQFAQATAHGMLDAIETDIGASPVLYVRSGAPPSTLAAADGGTLIATIPLAADAFANAAAWSKGLPATASDLTADATGKPGHFRIKTSGGTSKIQGIAAGPWAPNTAYVIGDTVTNDSGKVYRATVAGTSASSGGPSGTSASITDSGVTWAYVQASADMSFDAGIITAGQQIDLTSFAINFPAANQG